MIVHGQLDVKHQPTYNNLRELFYDRDPGDARVKVGSERQAATSPARAELRCRRDRLF